MGRMEGLKRFAEKAAGPLGLAGAVLAAALLSALVPSPEERERAAGPTEPIQPAQSSGSDDLYAGHPHISQVPGTERR